MSMFSAIKNVYHSAKVGWHHGKAGKYLRRGDCQSALKHYLLAYEYSRSSEDVGGQAVELECIARTHFRLNDFVQARQYAEKSLAIYQKFQTKGKSDLFSESVSRVEQLLVRLQT